MFKDKLNSAKNFVSDNRFLLAGAGVIAGVIAIEMKYPGTFDVEEKKPEIPTMKIIHVHVNE